MAVFLKRDKFQNENLPYVRLKSIQSAGKQYIDTGFIPTSTSRVILDINILSENSVVSSDDNTYPAIFGSRQGTNQRSFCFWLLGKMRDYHANGYENITLPSKTGRFLIDKNKNVTKINHETMHVFENVSAFTTGATMSLFTVNTKGTVDPRKLVAKIYSCKIYDNDVLVRDYIPVKMKDTGKIGLWDKVANKFYGNAGTGSFVEGG